MSVVYNYYGLLRQHFYTGFNHRIAYLSPNEVWGALVPIFNS